MGNLVQTYVLHDSDPAAHGGARRINRKDAHAWNAKGFGVFHTVQAFYLNRRKENFRGINAWYVDMDEGTKEAMFETLKRGLIPTMIVETKKGYHAYWKAKDATVLNWKQIIENRLVPYYKADKKAQDLARILRTPGYLHMKDPANPFPVKRVHYQHVEYSEREIFQFYPDAVTASKQKRQHNRTCKEHPMAGSFWDRVWNLNCEYALEKLSGTPHVDGEVYEFKQNASGTKNIYVNGKSTSCWVDLDGRIGSTDSGGPTIAKWLNWYRKDYARTVEIISEVFPECKTESQITLL